MVVELKLLQQYPWWWSSPYRGVELWQEFDDCCAIHYAGMAKWSKGRQPLRFAGGWVSRHIVQSESAYSVVVYHHYPPVGSVIFRKPPTIPALLLTRIPLATAKRSQRNSKSAFTSAWIFVLTLRRLMSYIYGAPILDVSRSHTTTQHSR